MFRDLYILLLLYIFVTSEAATNEMCGYRNLSLKWLNYLAFISYSKMVDKILVQPITFKQIGHLHWFPASALWIRGSPWPPRGPLGDDFCLVDLAGFILILREKFFVQIPYARHYNPLLIRNHSWILTIHKAKGQST